MLTRLLAILLALALAPSLRAQDPSLRSEPALSNAKGQGISPSEYGARRDSLAARIDSGVVIAFGAPDPTGPLRWVQFPAFRYLTGFLEPNAALVLVKQAGAVRATLYTA